MHELHLGMADMDATHDAFFALLDRLQRAQKRDFVNAFASLIEHTKDHFAHEEQLMRTMKFYGMTEHLEEHAALLGEMEYFYDKATKMRAFGISYANEYAYEKFRRHIINIDSQLAMFLKQQLL